MLCKTEMSNVLGNHIGVKLKYPTANKDTTADHSSDNNLNISRKKSLAITRAV